VKVLSVYREATNLVHKQNRLRLNSEEVGSLGRVDVAVLLIKSRGRVRRRLIWRRRQRWLLHAVTARLLLSRKGSCKVRNDERTPPRQHLERKPDAARQL
jgi:hypothetical protein